MPQYLEFRRTSGRNLTAVRRPAKAAPKASDLDALKKDELKDLAEARGLDTSGTKAELAERLSDG